MVSLKFLIFQNMSPIIANFKYSNHTLGLSFPNEHWATVTSGHNVLVIGTEPIRLFDVCVYVKVSSVPIQIIPVFAGIFLRPFFKVH